MSGVVPINSRNNYISLTLEHGAVLTVTAALAMRAADCLTVHLLTAHQPRNHVYTYPPVSRAAQIALRVCGALGACLWVKASIAYKQQMAFFLLFLSLMCLNQLPFYMECHFNTYNNIHSWIGFKNFSLFRASDLQFIKITDDVVIKGNLPSPLAPNLRFQNLTISDYPDLKSLTDICVFSNLKIENCCNLSNLQNITVIGHLVIDNCSNLESLTGIQFVRDLTIKNCCNLSNLQDVSVKGHLVIDSCPNLESLTGIQVVGNLNIKNCCNLSSLQNSSVQGHLVIDNCPNLERLSQIETTGYLDLHKAKCVKLKFFSGQFYSSINCSWDWGPTELTDDSIKELIKNSSDGGPMQLASAEQKKNKEIVLASLRKGIRAFAYIDQALKEDVAIQEAVCDQFVRIIRCNSNMYEISELLKQDKMLFALFIAAVNKWWELRYDYNLREKLTTFILDVFRKNGLVLQHIPHDLQDRDMIRVALQQDGRALEFVKSELRDDDAINLIAIVHSVDALPLVKEEKRERLTALAERLKTQESALQTVEEDGMLLECIHSSLQESDRYRARIAMQVVCQNGLALRFVDRQRVNYYREIVSAAIRRNGMALQFVVEYLRGGEYGEAATLQNPMALQFVPFEQQRNSVGKIKGWVVHAVAQDNKACQYVDPTLVHPSIVQAYAHTRVMSLAKPLQEVIWGRGEVIGHSSTEG